MAVWGQHRPSDLRMSFCPCESVGLLAPPLRRSRQRLRKHELLSQQPGRSDWVPILQMLREIKPHALLPAPGTPPPPTPGFRAQFLSLPVPIDASAKRRHSRAPPRGWKGDDGRI